MSDLMKRVGIIDVSIDLVRENPEGLLKVFKDILVLDVKPQETQPTGYILHYRGVSKHFDIVNEGEKVPKYYAQITVENNKITAVEFKKCINK